MDNTLPLFDAHLHPECLTDQDLESLCFFGVRGALILARDALCTATKDYRNYFQDLLVNQTHRLLRASIHPYVALGVHPGRLPKQGLEEVLSFIPALPAGGRLVAIGEIGLLSATPQEEQALERQVELARELNLPIVVHTPEQEKRRVTKRVLSLLRNSGLEEKKVLLGHSSGQTIRLIRECGYWAGLTVSPDHASAEAVLGLVRGFGSEGIILASGAGQGAQDILALPRVSSLLRESGLSPAVTGRVLAGNVLAFLNLEPKLLLREPSRSPRARRQ